MRGRRQKKQIAGMLAVLLLLLCGCGPAAEQTENKTIGFLASEFSNEFMIAMQQSFLDRAEGLGLEVKMEICNQNPEIQMNQVYDLIAQGVDALAIRPTDSASASALLEAANKSNIPVFLYDTRAEEGSAVSFITTDNYSVGSMAGEAVGRLLREKKKGLPAKIAVVTGISELSSHADRLQGFLDTLSADYPEIEVVSALPARYAEDALNLVLDWLSLYGKELDGIYAVSDYLTTPVLEGIRFMGYTSSVESPEGLVVVGTDGNPDTIAAIRAGELSGTVSQNAMKIGAQTADILYQYLIGKEPVERVYYIPSLLITPDNVDSEEVKAFGLWADEYQEKYAGGVSH